MSTSTLRYRKGVKTLDESRQWIVGGVKRMNRLDDPEHFPLFFRKGRGPYVWDIDGNRYIDLIAGKGAIIFGYADKRVDDAVRLAVENGSMLPLTSDLYPRTARSVCEQMPAMERVKFFRDGSCAVSAAVRLSRLFTGRTKILSCGYHGWHDWFLQDKTSYPDDAGDVVDFHYDLTSLAMLAEKYPGEVAAIVVTPEPSFFDYGFLESVAEIARSTGALFILDEMKTGFRFTINGYHALAEVTPDLITVGKAIANGYPLSAVGGRAEVMEAELTTHISGTYETENIGLAAALMTIELLSAADYNSLAQMYADFQTVANRAFRRYQLPARFVGSSFNAHLIFDDQSLAIDFYRGAAARGVTFYCFDDVNITFSHKKVIDDLLNTVEDTIKGLSRRTVRTQPSAKSVCEYLQRHKILSKSSTPHNKLVKKLHQQITDD